MDELKQLIYGDQLQGKLRDLPPQGLRRHFQLHIYDCGELPYAARLEVLGARAAAYVGEVLVPKMRSVGVTWGVTLRCLVDELDKRFPAPPRADDPVCFFPTCGDPPEVQHDPHRGSSILVTRLATRFNGSKTSEFSFSGVGASIPAGIRSARDVAAIRRYLLLNSRYRRVFGDGKAKGLIDGCDTILTSAGTAVGMGGPWLEAAAEAMEMTPRALWALTVGNIGGLFLPKPELTARAAQKLKEVNDRWTGIRLEHLMACASKASLERVGVVMIAAGDKTEILLECLRMGLVNHLIIDQVQAAALAKALGTSTEPKLDSDDGARARP